MLGVGFAFLVSVSGYAADVEVTETVRALGASEAQAGVNFKTSCEAWETAAKADAGEAVLYASCGGEEISPLQTETVTEECGDYVYPGGNVVYMCYPKYTKNRPYGFIAVSLGKVLLNVSGDYGVITDKVLGTKGVCSVSGGTACLTAREQAVASFNTKCTAFKANAKKSFGTRFLYASCGKSTNVGGAKEETAFQYQGEGVIYYKK